MKPQTFQGICLREGSFLKSEVLLNLPTHMPSSKNHINHVYRHSIYIYIYISPFVLFLPLPPQEKFHLGGFTFFFPPSIPHSHLKPKPPNFWNKAFQLETCHNVLDPQPSPYLRLHLPVVGVGFQQAKGAK